MGISSLFYGLFKLESGTGCENTFRTVPEVVKKNGSM